MIEKTMEVDRMEDVISVFGSFDQNLRMIETEYNVRVTDRDEQIHITGEAENVLYAEKAIAGLLSLAAKGEEIGEQNVRYIFRLVREGREQKIQELAGDVVCITAKGKPIKAKTLGQRAYLDAIEQNTITLGVGPAGTGKTYLAVAEAVAAFRAERVNRIILTRPAVEAGERLGFLPGDLQNKVDPYLRPLYDALFEMLGADAYAKYLERGNIEVAPLAYMRGRTLDDSFIILDEAQNTSREQMKMFLTRIGFGSHVVITGDVTQIDLPSDKPSGLKEAIRILDGIDHLHLDCHFVRAVLVFRAQSDFVCSGDLLAEFIDGLIADRFGFGGTRTAQRPEKIAVLGRLYGGREFVFASFHDLQPVGLHGERDQGRQQLLYLDENRFDGRAVRGGYLQVDVVAVDAFRNFIAGVEPVGELRFGRDDFARFFQFP